MSALDEVMQQWELVAFDDAEVYELIYTVHDILDRDPETEASGALAARLLDLSLDAWRWDELSWAAQELMIRVGFRDALLDAAHAGLGDPSRMESHEHYADVVCSHSLNEHLPLVRALADREEQELRLRGYQGLVGLLGAEVRGEVEMQHNLAPPEHRAGWLRLLSKLPGPTDRGTLLRALENPDAIEATLAMIAPGAPAPEDEVFVDPVIAIALDPDYDLRVRREAVRALTRMQSARAAEALGPLLEPEDELDITPLLISQGHPRFITQMIAVGIAPHQLTAVSQMIAQGHGTSEEREALRGVMIDVLETSADDWELEVALEGLTRLFPEDPKVLELIQALLAPEREQELRRAAAHSLSGMTLPEVPGLLLELLHDDVMAESVLRTKSGVQASWVPRLLEIVGPAASWAHFNPDIPGARPRRVTFLRQGAMLALGEAGTPEARERVLEVARVQGGRIVGTVFTALSRFRTPDARPIFEALRDETEGMPYGALGALADLGDEDALAALLSALEDPRSVCPPGDDVETLHNRIAFELARLGRPEALPRLHVAVYSRYWDHRHEACRLLGMYLEEPEAKEALEVLTRDRDASLRQCAYETLQGAPYRRFSSYAEFDGVEVE